MSTRPGVEDRLEARALVVGHVRVADERRRVVHVEVGPAHVEVAGDQHRPLVGDQLGHALGDRLEEPQLVGERGRIDRLAVRHVDADGAHAVHVGLDPAGLVARGLALEPGALVLDLRPGRREQRDAGPAPGAVVDRLVAGRLELHVRERVRLALRLLQEDEVGPVLLQQLEDARHAHLERVDVPRRNAQGVRNLARGR